MKNEKKTLAEQIQSEKFRKCNNAARNYFSRFHNGNSSLRKALNGLDLMGYGIKRKDLEGII